MGKKKHTPNSNTKKNNQHHHHQQQNNINNVSSTTSSTGLDNSISSLNDTTTNVSNNTLMVDDPKIAVIVDWKTEGNALFGNKKYTQSIEAYDKALALLSQQELSTFNNQQQQLSSLTMLMVQILSNRAMAYIKLNEYHVAENDCNRILDELNVHDQPKVWYRRAVAREGMAVQLLSMKTTSSSSSTTSSINSNNKKNNNLNSNHDIARELLLLAKSDLQASLKCTTTADTVDNNAIRNTVATTAVRIQKTLLQISANNNNNNNEKSMTGVTKIKISDKDNITNNKAMQQQSSSISKGSSLLLQQPLNSSSPRSTSSVVVTPRKQQQRLTPSSSSIEMNINRPNQQQQRHDVLQLLIARKVSIANHYNNNNNNNNVYATTANGDINNNNSNNKIPESIQGEGFFLLDWNWWCQWTRHTKFFETNSMNNGSNLSNQEQQQKLLKYFIVGTRLPNDNGGIVIEKNTSISKKKNNKKKNNKIIKSEQNPTAMTDDDDDSTTSSSSSSSDDDDMDDSPPGPIDNSELLLLSSNDNSSSNSNSGGQQAFYRHWYEKYYQQQCNNHVEEQGVDDCEIISLSSTTEDTKINDTTKNNTTNKKTKSLASSSSSSGVLMLRPNLVRGYHYEVIPREVYNALRTWYCEVTPPICKRTIMISNDNNRQELHIYPHVSTFNNNNNDSTNNQYQNGGSTAAAAAAAATTVPEKSISKASLLCSACRAPDASMRCRRCMVARYCNRGCQESHWPCHKVACSELASRTTATATNNDTATTAAAANNETSDTIITHYINDGRVGLNNLGNTCFMNSAIQCLSHATPLTRHFLSGLFKEDINPDNPLGTGGKLALAYAVVLKDLWWSYDQYNNSNSNTYHNLSASPTALKRAIALFAPRFAGYLQHDAQEFLAYLLDGLHEDMNRITNAPYVVMPDVSTANNMAIAAAHCWDAHKRRNDSIVLDTFYGQFKSTCVCPKCDKVSVSFDAFNHVSLEIPQPSKPKNEVVPFPVLVFFAKQRQQQSSETLQTAPMPVRYGVPYYHASNYSVGDFVRELSNLCQIPVSRLILCEVYRHAIVNLYQDHNKPLSDVIRMNDFVVAYEIEHTFDDPNGSHVIVGHCFVDPIAAKQKERSPQDRHPQPQPFGIPFLTSFHESFTCRQVWDHIWSRVQNLINPKAPLSSLRLSSLSISDDDAKKSLLEIRVVDMNGRAKNIFPRNDITHHRASGLTSHAEHEDDALHDEQRKQQVQDMTSLLPRDLDQKLSNLLGKESDSFIFLCLEWTDPTDEIEQSDDEGGNGEHDNSNGNVITEHFIDEERFTTFENHVSWLEAVKNANAAAAPNKKTQDRVTLEECFETFTKPERLDEHNMWYCSNCKEHVRAMKTMQLWRLPNILIIHLKRFEFKMHHGFRRDKLETLVNFPLEGLDMSQQCCRSNYAAAPTVHTFVNETIPAVYDCFAVTNHFGSMGFGHYTAFARKWNESSPDALSHTDWALFDDASVRPLMVGDKTSATDIIVSPAAYVLFYRRRIFH